MKILTVSMFLLSLCAYNRQIKFNYHGWTTGADAGSPPAARKLMLSDLLATREMVGMRFADVEDLLGRPDEIDSSAIYYEIELDYGGDIDPVYRKDLILNMDSDSIVTGYKVREEDLSPGR